MSKTLFEGYSKEEIANILQANADRIEESTYFKELSNEELDIKRETLTARVITLSEMDDQKKEFMSALKDRAKPLIEEKAVLLKEIKHRRTEVKGIVYHSANHESGFMETYSADGEFISSRRLLPDERQKTIFSIQKAQ